VILYVGADARDESIQAMTKDWLESAVDALVPQPLQVFARSRWCTSGNTARELLLLTLAHDLLNRSIPVWLSKLGHKTEVSVWDDLAEVVLEGLEGDQYWSAFNEKQHGDALRFAKQTATSSCIVFSHLCMVPCTKLMDRFLRQAAEDWDRCEAQDAAQGQRRAFRLTDAASGRLTHEFFREVHGMFFNTSSWKAVPERCCTQKDQSMAFAMLARSVCGVHAQIEHHLSACPYKLWLLIDPGTSLDIAVSLLLSIRPCQWADFTRRFMHRYPTADDMRSTEARCVLQAVAILFRVDTSRVECRHAWARRLLRLKGLCSVYAFAQQRFLDSIMLG
jgi:hypothetical protein